MGTSNYKAVQAHGEIFENLIKSSFPGASNFKRTPTEIFDIEKKFDKNFGLPTSIKTSKGNIVCMADACRVFSIDEDFRIIILQYKQEGKNKVPFKLYEFLPTKDEWNDIKGNMPYLEIKNFHEKIKEFKIGFHDEARKFSKLTKLDLLKRYETSLILNPKIDSKNQRRLQVSIKLNTLLNKVHKQKIYESNNGLIMFNGISIAPIESTAREFENTQDKTSS